MLDQLNIIVVDDESAIRDTLQKILEVRGYKVYVTANVYTAIQIA